MLICAACSGAREKLPVLPAESSGALTVIYSAHILIPFLHQSELTI